MVEVLIIAVWIACGVLFFGISYAYWVRNWPTLAGKNYREDWAHTLFLSVLGPIALFAGGLFIAFRKGFKGFKYRRRLDDDWPEQVYQNWLALDWCDPDSAWRITNKEVTPHGFKWEEPGPRLVKEVNNG